MIERTIECHTILALMITGREKAPLGQKTTHLAFFLSLSSSATYRYLLTYSFFIGRVPIFLEYVLARLTNDQGVMQV